MKYKLNEKIIFLFFLIVASKVNTFNEIQIASTKSWCWTKPIITDPSFILNENNGGINWGFCKSKSETILKKKLYIIYVSTSSLPGSETTSKLYISFQGTEGKSKEQILSPNGFKKGSFIRIKLFSEDVGNLQSIRIRNGGTQAYRCNSIKIESGMNYWNFECKDIIKCPNCAVTLDVVNLVTYEVSVKTSSIQGSGTIEPVYIKIIGTQGKTPEKLISDKGLKQGSLIQVQIDTVDVGSVYGITLVMKGYDMWRPEELIVKKPGNNLSIEEKIFKIPPNTVLESPVKPFTITIPKPESSSANEETSSPANPSSLLDNKDQSRIIKLSCTDIVKENDKFGPNYVGSFVNYMNFIIECPSNCHKEEVRAVGLGIHPEESPVCINALVDRAMSFYGGIISVSIFKGLSSYTGGKKIFGFPVLSYGVSKKSYSITKVDNIDMISKDVRILDSDGKSSPKGRLEMRNDGIWGTVCAKDLDDSAAKLICKEIGFKGGKFLNPPTEKGRKFCSNFEGLNLCGAKYSYVHFSSLKCQGGEKNIRNCFRKMADFAFCGHDYDTLIECSNTSQDEVGAFQTGTIRLIDASGNPAQTGIGRLEVLKENWGTICNTKFTSKAAKVACKQMGFLDGKVFGDSEGQGSCSNVLGNDLCGQFNVPIKFTDLICSGHEKNLSECSLKTNTVSCTHFNDVVIKCEGYGDPSGRSQNIRPPKVLSPLIEKFPMKSIFNAKCESTASQIYFRGDPGSVYLVQCPSECSSTNYIVTGTGVYTANSSICKAAIQSGVITDEGGQVVLTKTYGQNKYFGSLIRNISSQTSNYQKSSFFISSPNSAFYNMVAMINNASFLQISSNEKLVPAISKNNFIEIYSKKSKRKKPFYSSFIETGNVLECVFDWHPSNNNFRFDGNKVYVDLLLLDDSKKILGLKSFTIFLKFKMTGFNNNNQIILSVGACEGYSIIIDKNSEIIFDAQCGKKIYKSGIYMPLHYQITLSVVYDGSKITYFLNGKKYSDVTTYFDLSPQEKITLGKHSSFDKWYFNGKIYFIAFFPDPFGIKRNKQLINSGYSKPARKFSNKFTTLDNRSCVTPCAVQTIPGVAGSPKPPPEALKCIYFFKLDTINGQVHMIKGFSNEPTIEEKIKNDVSALKEITCKTTPRHLLGEEIKKGDKRRVKCPKGCKKEKSLLIFGTILYTLDSPICLSAIHSGIIKDKGGNVMIKVMQALKYYLGTRQFGIQSSGINKSDFSYTIEQASPVLTISCKTQGNNNLFSGKIGSKYLVKCPVNCSRMSHNVFGNQVYSADSSICQAAIHAGALNDRGGEVNFVTANGLKQYFGLKAFNVESKDRESYVKSFKFFGKNKNSFKKFREEFNTIFVTKNWDVVDDLEANNYPSNWKYVQSTLRTKSKFILHQSSKIKSDKPYSYGSMILLKKADLVNFIFNVNFYFVNMNSVGIIFRYKDENNYYSLRLNNLGPFKIILIKNYEGKSTILSTSTLSITPRIWYSFTLRVYFDSISVSLQIGELRNQQQIFDVKDNDLQIGSLGLATNGNDDFYVSVLNVDNYKRNGKNVDYSKIRRTYETILIENTPIHRYKYCKSLFDNDTKKINNCKEFHNYCRNKCNDEIHKRETVLNYNCYKSCVKDSIQKNKLANMSSNDIGSTMNPKVWSPKEKQKCDYKPDDLGPDSTWVPCEITNVENNPNDPEQKIIKLSYTIKNSVKTVSLLYPSIVLKKCGSAISGRKDCG